MAYLFDGPDPCKNYQKDLQAHVNANGPSSEKEAHEKSAAPGSPRFRPHATAKASQESHRGTAGDWGKSDAMMLQ